MDSKALDVEKSSPGLRRRGQVFRDSDDPLRILFENFQAGLMLMKGDTCVDCNPEMVRLFGGKHKEQMIGKGPCDFSPEKQPDGEPSRDKVPKIIKIVSENGSHRFDWVHRRFNGDEFEAEVSITAVPVGGEEIHFVVVRDISSGKEAQERIRELARENEAIYRIGRIISSTLNIDEVYEGFAGEVNQLIPFDRITVKLINPDNDSATIAFVSGLDVEGEGIGDSFRLEGSTVKEAVEIRSAFLFQPGSRKEVKKQFPFLLPNFQLGLKSFLSVALISRNEVVGSLLIQSQRAKAYTERELRLAERIAAEIASAIANARLFIESQQAKESLLKKTGELEERTRSLEEANTALKVLLKQRAEDRRDIEESILSNVREVVLPIIEKLKNGHLNPRQQGQLKNALEEHLKDIISPFLHNLASQYSGLTRREMQVANLIKEGKTTKEVAALLAISERATEYHRNNLRRKLNLKSEQPRSKLRGIKN